MKKPLRYVERKMREYDLLSAEERRKFLKRYSERMAEIDISALEISISALEMDNTYYNTHPNRDKYQGLTSGLF